MQLLNLNAKLLRDDTGSIGLKEFVQELETSFDSTLNVTLMEEERAAAQLPANR
jgi:hypothetical protein